MKLNIELNDIGTLLRMLSKNVTEDDIKKIVKTLTGVTLTADIRKDKTRCLIGLYNDILEIEIHDVEEVTDDMALERS